MDTRRLIMTVLITFLIWSLIQQVFFPKPPEQQTTTAPAATQSAPSATLPFADTNAAMFTADARVIENDKINDQIILGNGIRDNGYEMLTIFSNRGASLNIGQLSNFSESVKEKSKGYEVLKPVKYPKIERSSLATDAVILTKQSGEKLIYSLANAKWFYKTLNQGDDQAIRFWIDLAQNDTPLARVVKTFSLTKDSFDLKMTIAIENSSDEAISVVLTQMGAIGVRKEDPRSEDRKIFVGTIDGDDSENIAVSSGLMRSNLEKKDNLTQKLGAANETVLWAGEVNKYFAALLSSVDAQGKLNGDKISNVNAKAFTDDKEFGEDLTTLWITKPMSIAAKGTDNLYFELYLGPKSDKVFTLPKYQTRGYMRTFDKSWCTLQFLADFMAWLLERLFFITRNYGVAIILLVVIVRVVLHPVTKSSQMNMMRMQRDMQTLSPKLNALKEKYKDDRAELNKATMELYKNEGINPAGQMLGCLPMMIQMPLWIALWTALNNTFELRHQPFFFWIKDLAAPDTLITFSDAINIPILSAMIGPVHSLNVLPMIMTVSMILQQKFNPQSAPTPDADPGQAKQQKIMFYFMGIFFGLILYNAPSGLNLYILTSNFLGLIETRRVRQHLAIEATLPPKVKAQKVGLWSKILKRVEAMAKEYEAEKDKAQKAKRKSKGK